MRKEGVFVFLLSHKLGKTEPFTIILINSRSIYCCNGELSTFMSREKNDLFTEFNWCNSCISRRKARFLPLFFSNSGFGISGYPWRWVSYFLTHLFKNISMKNWYFKKKMDMVELHDIYGTNVKHMLVRVICE